MAKKLSGSGDWFIAQRTRSLATIYLTRRDDLVIAEARPEDGVDLTVVIKTKKEATDRKFGVVLRGTKSEFGAAEADSHLQATVQALSAREFTYPVCLFLFQMENDTGFFTWVAEPVVTADGSLILKHRAEAACADLDTAAINSIVGSVSAWYDAFLKSVIDSRIIRWKASGIEVLHGIIDGEAAYFSEHGNPPKLLRLPMRQAFELAKLGREHLGDLAGHIIKDGVRVLERDGLLGMKVSLVTSQQDFSFE